MIALTDPPHEARTISGELSRWVALPQASGSRWTVPWQVVPPLVFVVGVLGFAAAERRRVRRVTA